MATKWLKHLYDCGRGGEQTNERTEEKKTKEDFVSFFHQNKWLCMHVEHVYFIFSHPKYHFPFVFFLFFCSSLSLSHSSNILLFQKSGYFSLFTASLSKPSHFIFSVFFALFLPIVFHFHTHLPFFTMCSIYLFVYANSNAFYACTGNWSVYTCTATWAAPAAFCIVIYVITRRYIKREGIKGRERKREMAEKQGANLSDLHKMQKSNASRTPILTAFSL